MNQFVPFRKNRRLTGAQKSAILFLCIGEERGGALMQELDVAEIQKITSAITNMGEIDAKIVEEIMEEFDEKVNAPGGVVGNIEAARGLLQKFLPEERVAEILAEMDKVPTENVWDDLAKLDEKQLTEILRKERNQTVAVILARISPEAAAKVLPLLGPERAAEVLARVMEIENLPTDAISNIEKSLRDDVLVKIGRGSEGKVEGQLVSIFNKLDEELFSGISKDLEKRDAERFGAIKQKMFVFNDLIKFKENNLAKIMREVGGTTLPLALRGAKKELRDHFLGSLPARSRDMLQEEMDQMGPVRSKDVREAQSQLVEAALRLLADGTVELPMEDEDLLED